MSEIPRMSISKFKATAKAGMDLPVIITVDGEDAFAVVPIAQIAEGESMVRVLQTLVADEEEPAWLPPDAIRDS
ncbi:MAG: hypothetical protein Q7O66_07320 [Dehalococcoidia bacterium]|nr:hypothetical protein [Dehalococcoidia bacterium]